MGEVITIDDYVSGRRLEKAIRSRYPKIEPDTLYKAAEMIRAEVTNPLDLGDKDKLSGLIPRAIQTIQDNEDRDKFLDLLRSLIAPWESSDPTDKLKPKGIYPEGEEFTETEESTETSRQYALIIELENYHAVYDESGTNYYTELHRLLELGNTEAVSEVLDFVKLAPRSLGITPETLGLLIMIEPKKKVFLWTDSESAAYVINKVFNGIIEIEIRMMAPVPGKFGIAESEVYHALKSLKGMG
jgi:hypothetical protein